MFPPQPAVNGLLYSGYDIWSLSTGGNKIDVIVHNFSQRSWKLLTPWDFRKEMFCGCFCWWGANVFVCALCFRDRALSSWTSVHGHHGGKLHRDGRAVPHAGAGCPLQGLAGPPGSHHLSFPADAALLGVSISCSCQVTYNVSSWLWRCFALGKRLYFTIRMSLSLWFPSCRDMTSK